MNIITKLAAAAAVVVATVAHAGTTNFNDPDLSDWTTDRYTPAVFQTTIFDGDSRLQQGVRAADNQANRAASFASGFYNYQGMQQDVDVGATAIGIDLFVDSTWNSGTRAGMWGVLNDGLGDLTYPIIEYVVDGENSPGTGGTFTGFRYWDSSFGWTAIAGAFGTDAWYTLGITLTATDVLFSIDGSVVATIGNLGAVQIDKTILNVHNQGLAGDYDVYWDNYSVSVVPLPTAALAGLGMLGAFAGVRTIRRRA